MSRQVKKKRTYYEGEVKSKDDVLKFLLTPKELEKAKLRAKKKKLKNKTKKSEKIL